MNQLSIDFSRARRDLGIQRAADHAGSDWQRQARGYLLEWLTFNRQPFLAEDWREWAMTAGLQSPPDGRAFGAVLQSAQRDKLIKSCGFRQARSSNMSPKVLWVAQ